MTKGSLASSPSFRNPYSPLRIYFIFVFAFLILPHAGLQGQETEKYEVVKIDFQGNSSYSGTSLKKLMTTQETPAWFWKFLNSFSDFGKPPVYFDSSMIFSDIGSLQDFYYSNGFFNFSATSNYKLDSAAKTASLTFTITEGAPSTYSNVKTYGFDKLPATMRRELAKVLTFDSTARFSKTGIKSGIDACLTYLENNGYMNARYDSTIVIKDTARAKADISIFFSSGLAYSISSVRIEKKGDGADFVSDDMLRDIVGIDSADQYSLEKIRLSQVRLFRTGLFSSVILGPQIEEGTGNSVPILLTGTIGKINEASPEIIVNNQQNTFNVGLAGNYTRKNFYGRARKLTFDVSSGVRDVFNSDLLNIVNAFSLKDTSIYGFFEGTARIEQPYVFNRPIFGILEGYYKMSKDRISNKRTYGGKLTFEFELPAYTFLNFLIAYYNLEVVNEVFFDRGVEARTNEALAILGAEAKSFKANDPMYPSRGYNLSFLLEEGNSTNYLFSKLADIPFTGAIFYRASITSAGYLPVAGDDNKVLAGKLKCGYLQHFYGEEKTIPTTRKFTSGGSNSMRGWKARQLAPFSEQILSGKTVEVGGGSFLLESSLEYRHRFMDIFGAVFFIDAGNTWLGYGDFHVSDVAVNTGIGFRVYTPFAPVRIDFGMKLSDPLDRRSILAKQFFNNTFEFQFGIGEAF